VDYIEKASKNHTSLFEELVYRQENTPPEETYFHVQGKDLKVARITNTKNNL
jgi:hypothetical protein